MRGGVIGVLPLVLLGSLGTQTAAARTVAIPSTGDWDRRVQTLKPGDVAQLEPGRYAGMKTLTVRGAPGRPILVRGAGTRETVLDGGSRGHVLRLKDCADLVIENFTVTNPSPYGQDLDGRRPEFVYNYMWRKDEAGRKTKKLAEGIIISGGERIVIRKCRFADVATRGILAGSGLIGLTVEQNLFVRIGDDTASGDVGLGGCAKWTIRENLFAGNVDGVVGHGVGAEGLIERNLFCFLKWENAIDLKFHGPRHGEDPWTVIRDNVIYADHCRYSGVELQDSSDNIKVYGNVIRGAAVYGLQIRGRSGALENLEIVGNWFDANGDRKTGINVRVQSTNPGDVRNVHILHNVFTGYGRALRVGHGENVFIYNNIFDDCPVSLSIQDFSCGTNLYHDTDVWNADNSAVVGRPVFKERPVGPLAAGSPGFGRATVLPGHDWGRDVGLPQTAAGIAGLESSILRALEQVFTREEITECMDQGGLQYSPASGQERKERKEKKPIILPDGTEVIIVGGIPLRRRREEKEPARKDDATREPRRKKAARRTSPPAGVEDADRTAAKDDLELKRLYVEAETLFIDEKLSAAAALFRKIAEQYPESTYAEKARAYLDMIE